MDLKNIVYKNRIADKKLKQKLELFGAVLIEGIKWCGKTTTAIKQANSVLFFDKPDSFKRNLQIAENDISILLEGEPPHFIDEWQFCPKLYDAIRHEVDSRNIPGQFILAGSSSPYNLSEINHSGTGRISRIKMRTMSLFESGESNGSASLLDVFDSKKISGINNLTLNDIAYLSCRGGWPYAIKFEKEQALEFAFDYIDSVISYDISKNYNINYSKERIKKILISYSRCQGTQATDTTINQDIISSDENILLETTKKYLDILKDMFVIEESRAWNPNLRSKTAIRTRNTRYFTDPSIATASLGLGPKDLISDLETFGFIFETLCIRDLRIYADSLNGEIFHYRDKSGLECDAIIHLRDSRYGLIEIKIGGETLIDDAIKNLKKLSDNIDLSKMKKPSFLMVLTATGDFAYRNNDGIYIVPIGCLKD